MRRAPRPAIMCFMEGSRMRAEGPSPTIRRARPDDARALAALKLATFRETFLEGFRIPYPPADLARFEAEMYSAEQVMAEIDDAGHATWVCESTDGSLL